MAVETDATTPDALKDAICRHLRYSLARECDRNTRPRFISGSGAYRP